MKEQINLVMCLSLLYLERTGLVWNGDNKVKLFSIVSDGFLLIKKSINLIVTIVQKLVCVPFIFEVSGA